jgi:formylglycine-generating enzyme required for sulfatase activity
MNQLENPALDHDARLKIGQQLDQNGDVRPGVGLASDGLPDVAWCFVETPDESITFKDQFGVVFGDFRLKPFYIARYPVTVVQFAAFTAAEDGFANPAWWQDMTERYRHQEVLPQRQTGQNVPRDTVSWYQAVAFSRWLNFRCDGMTLGEGITIGKNAEIRLPHESEWQWAAQGSDGRTYPWGDWDARFANTRASRLASSSAVGLYPMGASWCGALDMSGDLWEWCLNEYRSPQTVSYESYLARVLRGGSFADHHEWAVCASRFNDLPNRRLDYFGFRVVCAFVQLPS